MNRQLISAPLDDVVVLLNGGTFNGSGISGKVVGDGKVGVKLVDEEGFPGGREVHGDGGVVVGNGG